MTFEDNINSILDHKFQNLQTKILNRLDTLDVKLNEEFYVVYNNFDNITSGVVAVVQTVSNITSPDALALDNNINNNAQNIPISDTY